MTTDNQYHVLTPVPVRLTYADAIGVLCSLSSYVGVEKRKSIVLAVQDWCDHTGWTMEETDDHIEVVAPIE